MESYHHHHHDHDHDHVMNLGSSRSSNSSSSSSTVQHQYDHDHDHDHQDQDHDHDQSSEDDQMMMMTELRRGPWTLEEDVTLMNHIANHGEGRWNSLARSAGLKRTGKSCRLRWLNYLRPDVRRGNITLEEQLLILELHSRWGNRWSKIAQHLPGRTDNEIKNYWRTRVQKHAKQLKCDVNSKQFKDTMRYLWMPRLVERIQAASGGTSTGTESCIADPTTYNNNNNNNTIATGDHYLHGQLSTTVNYNNVEFGGYTPENSSSDSFGAQVSPISDLTTDQYNNYTTATATTNTKTNSNYNPNSMNPDQYSYFQACNDQISNGVYYPDQSTLTSNYNNINGLGQMNNQGLVDFQAMDNNQWTLDQSEMSLWNNVDDVWFLQQQFNNTI